MQPTALPVKKLRNKSCGMTWIRCRGRWSGRLAPKDGSCRRSRSLFGRPLAWFAFQTDPPFCIATNGKCVNLASAMNCDRHAELVLTWSCSLCFADERRISRETLYLPHYHSARCKTFPSLDWAERVLHFVVRWGTPAWFAGFRPEVKPSIRSPDPSRTLCSSSRSRHTHFFLILKSLLHIGIVKF